MKALNSDLVLSRTSRRKIAPYIGFLSGILQSGTGISAPVVAAYIDSIDLSPKAYVFTVASIFTVLSGTHFIILLLLKAYSMTVFFEGIAAIFPVIIFVALGSRVREFISPEFFSQIIRLLLVLMAIRLIYNSWFI